MSYNVATLASATNAGAMPASAVAKLAALDQTALVAVAASWNKGGRGTFLADCTDWMIEDLDMDANGGGVLMIRGFTASNAANAIEFYVNGSNTGLTASYEYSNMNGGPPIGSSSTPPTLDCNSAGGIDLCPFTATLAIEHPSSTLSRRRFSFNVEFANNPTSGLWYAKWGLLFLTGGTNLQTLGIHSPVANGLALESDYSYISYGR